jgi:CRP/FNR family cyclic AMP-dependent transcriptional regulator
MLSVMEIIISLKHIPLFVNVHGEGLKRVSDVVREKNVSSGELVFAEKDLGEEMYLVHTGKILIYQDFSGRREPLTKIEPGGYFGEMAIIDEQPRSASASAEQDSILLVLHKDDFRSAVHDYPDIAFAVFKEFSRRVRQADTRIRSLVEELRRIQIETP